MNNTKTAETGLGLPHASQEVPRISVEGPDEHSTSADPGIFNDKVKNDEGQTPGMLEANLGNGRNLKKRNLTGNTDNDVAVPVRSNTGGLKRAQTEDKGWIHALLHPKPNLEKLQAPPVGRCLLNILKYSWLNVLLLMIPVSWAVHFAGLNDTLIFVFSFLSIIPLAALLGFATEELALRVGPTLGGTRCP